MKDALSLLRVLENPFDEVSWFRVLQLPEGVGPAIGAPADGRARRADGSTTISRRRCCGSSRSRSACPKAAVGGVRELRAALGDCLADESAHAAGRAARSPPRVPRAGLRAALRRGRVAHARPRAAGAARQRVRVARPVPLRAHARPAVVHRRPGRPAAPGRGLARPLHDPFGQGPGVGRRPRDPRRRRHDPVGHGHRRRRRDRGGAPAALRRHDPGARRVDRLVPAALLPPAARAGGSAQLRAAHAVPARGGPLALRRDRARTSCRCPTPTAIDGTADVDAFLAGLWAE